MRRRSPGRRGATRRGAGHCLPGWRPARDRGSAARSWHARHGRDGHRCQHRRHQPRHHDHRTQLADARQVEPALASSSERLRVAGVCVPHHARSGVGGQHALEPVGSVGSAVGENDHPAVDRVADADPTPVVDADPRRAGSRVEERVEDRPVGNRVGAVAASPPSRGRARRPSRSRGDRGRSPPGPRRGRRGRAR